MRTFILGTIVAAGLAGGAAQAASTGASKHVQIALVPEVTSLRPGSPFTVALHMKMEPKWHTYWINPGDAGKPAVVAWTLPEGSTAGPIQWPAPEAIGQPPLMSYGYNDEVALLVEITPAASLKPGADATLRADVKWLECADVCLPAKASLDVTLPVRAQVPAEDASVRALFASSRARFPGDGRTWKALAVSTATQVALTFQPPAGTVQSAQFFPEALKTLEHAAPQRLLRTSDGYSLELKRAAEAKPADVLTGVLRAETDAGPVVVRVEPKIQTADALPAGTPVAAPARAAGSNAGGETLGLSAALGLAFVGGLILNLMPCVLPVLSLKVLSFVRHASHEGGRTWQHGVAFTVGVVLSFLAMAGLLLVLRAGGQQIGWGFQLQSPRFVAGLASLFFLIGLNLFGVFEVGTSLMRAAEITARRTGLLASFGDGALATIVATPCTAPFMGSALGFALAQPAYVSLVVFTALGLGMAAPYLVLSMSPKLLRFVPKPGAWMETFKQLMGFFMMGTVVVLVWVFGRQTGADAVAFLLTGLVILGMAGWIYGRSALASTGRRRLAVATAAAVGLAGLALGVTAGAPAKDDTIAWVPFSQEAVDAARAAGRPVFIDFTAAWCLSCQVNERVALRPAEVGDRFQRYNIAAFKADLTIEDERLTAALESYGRSSIPLYVLYAPGSSSPRLLPVTLTPDIVLDALDENLGKNVSR
jgi:thiol:disulfide interchange protein